MNKYNIIYEKNSKVRLVSMSYRNFMMYSSNWIYNRDIDQDRVNLIYENIKDNDTIGWTLEAFRDKDDNIKIINGQHRGEAIRKFLANYDSYMDCNRNVILWIYDIESEEDNEEEIIELFKKVNSSFQLNEYEFPSKRKIDLCNKIKITPILKNGIRDDTRTSIAYQPYIHIKEFKVIFDKIILNNPDMSNNDIIDGILKINNRLSCICNEESFIKLFGRKQMNDKRLNDMNKCNEIRFYLNIKDSLYNRDVWINYIKNPELIII